MTLPSPTSTTPPAGSLPVSGNAAPAIKQLVVPGPKIILMGDSGTGKTEALKTLIKAGITPFIIATEQNFIQTMKDAPAGSWHYKYVNPTPDSSWGKFLDMAKKINDLSYENLTKVTDPFKQAHNKFLEIISICNNFVADDNGVSYGDASKWNTDRALVIDSLSGVSDMAMALVVGNKPVRSMPDWGVSQNAIKTLLGLCVSIRCTFILTAHIDREKDEITGGTTVTVKTLGQKLGPDLPRMFSDVIRTRRNSDKFVWDTSDTQAVVVGRHLPFKHDLEPSFVPLIENWKKEGGKIEATA